MTTMCSMRERPSPARVAQAAASKLASKTSKFFVFTSLLPCRKIANQAARRRGDRTSSSNSAHCAHLSGLLQRYPQFLVDKVVDGSRECAASHCFSTHARYMRLRIEQSSRGH